MWPQESNEKNLYDVVPGTWYQQTRKMQSRAAPHPSELIMIPPLAHGPVNGCNEQCMLVW